MLKKYLVKGKEYQFEEGKQPADAVEIRPEEKAAEKPANKVKPAPKNKAR